ncbi:hypothetical protein ACFQZS_08630 [Mucilaginibacter calamicampi]|uniref:Uncharacterized protein n=1 Tax=Mucilaginibacter calamicampi TaxID=1302352 RepID=A0ABW2YUU9_9SPHI
MRSIAYKLTCLIVLLAILIGYGCQTPPKEGVFKDKAIPADKATQLRQLNTDLFKAIKTDRDDAELLCSKELLKQKNLKIQFEYVNKLRTENEYFLLKDYYIVNKGGNDDDDILKGIENQEVDYQPLAKEMYFAFFVPKQKQNKIMLTLVYARYDVGWKANNIAIGYYTQLGKTGTQLFEAAKKNYAQGYLVNAINNIMLAANCKSGSAYLKAANGDEIAEFSKKVIDEANSKIKYPLMLSGVKTHPEVFSISSDAKEDEFVQYVYYLTKLKITDTAALKQENEQIKLQLPAAFPGINKGKKTMLYSAMNRKPIVGQSVDHMDFEEKIDN